MNWIRLSKLNGCKKMALNRFPTSKTLKSEETMVRSVNKREPILPALFF